MSRKSFKDYFIVPDEKEEPKVEVHQEEVKPAPTKKPAVQPQANPQPHVENGALEDEMYDKLSEFLTSHNLPGPDYLELKSAMAPLEKYIQDEDTRIRAAFDSLKERYPAMTSANIVEAIGKYKVMVEQERDRVVKDYDKKKHDLLDNVTKTISGLAKESEDIENQIETLKAELAKKKAKIETLEEEKTAKETDLDTNIQAFRQAATDMIKMLSEDGDKIKSLNL